MAWRSMLSSSTSRDSCPGLCIIPKLKVGYVQSLKQHAVSTPSCATTGKATRWECLESMAVLKARWECYKATGRSLERGITVISSAEVSMFSSWRRASMYSSSCTALSKSGVALTVYGANLTRPAPMKVQTRDKVASYLPRVPYPPVRAYAKFI